MEKGDNFDISLYPMKQLHELADVVAGIKVPSSQRLRKGVWQLIRGRNIVEDTVIPSNVFVREEIAKKHPKAIIVPDDILISTLFGKYKIGIVPRNLNPSLIDSGIVRIRPTEVQKRYLVVYLRTKIGKSSVLEKLLKATRGGVIKFVTVSDIRRLEIPIFPSNVLEGLDEKVLQKGSSEDLQNIYWRYEQEICKAIRSTLIQKGWAEDDILFEKEISANRRADLVLKQKHKPVAIIEVKRNIRTIDSVIRQIQIMCNVAHIPFGYIVSERGIWEISDHGNRVIERDSFPSPEELKYE